MRRSGPGRAADASHLSEAVAERLADVMFALSTPSRVLILGCLLQEPRSVGDLTSILGMEQSSVSHQLRVLREHALVRAERVGRQRVYALYDEHVTALLRAGLRHVEGRGQGTAAANDSARAAPGQRAAGSP